MRQNPPPPMDDETEENAVVTEAAPAAPASRLPAVLRRCVDHYWPSFCAFIQSRQPRLLSSLLVMCGVLILLGLGTWQLMRMSEKNAILHEVHQALAAAPRDLDGRPPADKAEWKALHMQSVTAKGVWEPLHRFRLAPRTYEQQVGYHLIVPFRLDSGQVVFVNRGFVPNGMSVVPSDGGKADTIQGVAYHPVEEKPRFAPENAPTRGEWVWLDLPAMAYETGMGNVAPVVVYENRHVDSNTYPIGGQLPLPYHNRHQQYAVTWYCMALALMGVWIMAIGPKAQPKPADDKQKTFEEPMDPVARRDRYPEATD